MELLATCVVPNVAATRFQFQQLLNLPANIGGNLVIIIIIVIDLASRIRLKLAIINFFYLTMWYADRMYVITA